MPRPSKAKCAFCGVSASIGGPFDVAGGCADMIACATRSAAASSKAAREAGERNGTVCTERRPNRSAQGGHKFEDVSPGAALQALGVTPVECEWCGARDMRREAR